MRGSFTAAKRCMNQPRVVRGASLKYGGRMDTEGTGRRKTLALAGRAGTGKYRTGALALSVALCIGGTAAAEVPGVPTEHQPRQLGIRAVMNVYYISPVTLEITSTAQLGWPTLDDCRAGMPSAIETAQRYASAGDLVEVQCVAVAVKNAANAQKPDGTTEL